MKFHSGPTFLPFPDTFPLHDPASLGLEHKNLCSSRVSSPCLLPNDQPGWNFPKKNGDSQLISLGSGWEQGERKVGKPSGAPTNPLPSKGSANPLKVVPSEVSFGKNGIFLHGSSTSEEPPELQGILSVSNSAPAEVPSSAFGGAGAASRDVLQEPPLSANPQRSQTVPAAAAEPVLLAPSCSSF